MRAKRSVVVSVLVALAVWPLAHMVLVSRYDVDPWRFCGFARYATPATNQWVHVYELRDDRAANIHESWLSPEAAELLREFRNRRALLGDLVAPHALARQLFEDRPEIHGLKILCQRDVVSPETSLLVVGRGTAYVYER